MTHDWPRFPAIQVGSDLELTRIHHETRHPAYFNASDAWRFGSPNRSFGVCYLGYKDPLAAYVEKYGRFGVITASQVRDDALSTLRLKSPVAVADLTERSILGTYGISNAHSAGSDYGPSQELAANLYDAGFAGIRYRIRHDPAMKLEAIALFGAPGEDSSRFSEPKTENPLPKWLIRQGSAFGIEDIPVAPLP